MRTSRPFYLVLCTQTLKLQVSQSVRVFFSMVGAECSAGGTARTSHKNILLRGKKSHVSAGSSHQMKISCHHDSQRLQGAFTQLDQLVAHVAQI